MNLIAVVLLSLLDFFLSHLNRWKMEKVEKQGKQNQDEDTSNTIDILLKVKPSRSINFIHRHINVSA